MSRFYGNDFLKQMLGDLGAMEQPVIRSVRALDELQAVYRLTHDCYVASGYTEAHATKMLVHYPTYDHIPETTILVAIVEGEIVGSVSLTVDGPCGLTIDEDFKTECDAIRSEGRAVGVVWRLVVDKAARNSRAVVTHLINSVVELALKKGMTTALFSVNPKHENVYQRMLNMEVAGRRETTEGLQNAPAVLLRGDVDKVLKAKVPADLPDFSTTPLFQLLANSPY